MAIEGLNTGFAITLYAYHGQVAMHSHVNCIFKSPLLLLGQGHCDSQLEYGPTQLFTLL